MTFWEMRIEGASPDGDWERFDGIEQVATSIGVEQTT